MMSEKSNGLVMVVIGPFKSGLSLIDIYYDFIYDIDTKVKRKFMNINPQILDFIQKNKGMITARQVEELGFTRALLALYAKNGLLERSRHGIYLLPDSIHDDMYTLMLCSEKIIFSHETALFLNHLSDRTPFEHSVTIPSNTKLSKRLQEECVCYYVKPELYPLGETQLQTTMGHTVRCYNVERTICDLLRSRNKLNEETVLSAIKNYAASTKKDLNLLAQYASLFGVSKLLRKYMEVLL